MANATHDGSILDGTMWRLLSRPLSTALGLLLAVALAAPASAAGPATGTLMVTSITPGARVELDGKLVGHLPLAKPLRLRAGRHKLKVSKPGFMEVEETVVVRAGKRTEQDVMLLAFAGVLNVRSDPEGAEVRIGGEVLGKTPLKNAELVPGEQTVVVALEGHALWEKKLEVQAGKTYQFRAMLEATAPGDVAVVDLAAIDAVELGGEVDPFAIVELDAPTPTPTPAPTPATATGEPASGPGEAPLAAVSPLPGPIDVGPAVAPGPRRPLLKQWWFWTAVGVLATGAIAAGAASAPPWPVLDCTPVSGVDGHLGLSACGR
ncbi:MAG: PEGA domain-containing protein [Deltaproteobacteria bacterium]|nr:PEGA domain-containing protein [Deltaproteobacteria bacterium]